MIKRTFIIGGIALGILFSITIFFWIQTAHTPYWWDSAGFLMTQAHRYLQTNFYPLVVTYSDFAHPPLPSMLFAFSWKLFGESVFVSHLVYLPFLLLTVSCCYILGGKLFPDKNDGRVIGFCTGLLLTFSPLYLAQFGIIYTEIPSAGFALLSYIFFLRKKYISYLIVASLMVLLQDRAALVIIIFFACHIVDIFKNGKKFSFSKIWTVESLLLLFPLIILFGWYYYHFSVTHWWFARQGRPFIDVSNLSIYFIPSLHIFIYIFLSQAKYLLTVSATLLFLGSYFYSQRMWKMSLSFFRSSRLPLILVPILYLLLFAKLEWLPRYTVIVLPFLYLLCVGFLVSIFSSIKKSYAYIVCFIVTCMLCFLFSREWDLHRKISDVYIYPIEENLEYLDIVTLGEKASAFLFKNYPHQTIYTFFPFNYMLSSPYQGFVTKPLNVSPCDEMSLKKQAHPLVVYHLFSRDSLACKQILDLTNYKSLATFTENGKSVSILQISGIKDMAK